jgi:hypothetical protein
MMRGLILAAAMLAPWSASAADPPGTITILEGEALIYRGAGRLFASEGVRLALGDIVETAASTFVQVELPDQSVIQFGPATRAMLSGSAEHQKLQRWLYVMNGWCKVAGPKAGAGSAGSVDVRSRLFDIPANPGVVVFQVTPAEVTLFVERGDVRLAERQASGSSIATSLKAGDYYRRKAPVRGVINPGATDTFLAEMPRSFRDSLPLRIDRFRDNEVRPRDAPDFAYADVEPWLKAEAWLRRPFVQRWRAKAREAAFRAALIANLPAHLEWDPVLFPEKYLPKDPPAKRAASASAPAPAHAPAPAPARPAGVVASPSTP